MSRKLILVLVLTLLLASMAVSIASAEHGAPIGGCPGNFELHHVMHDHDDHPHHHIGNDMDQNGDGYLCVMHVGIAGNNHVHVDNNFPFGF